MRLDSLYSLLAKISSSHFLPMDRLQSSSTLRLLHQVKFYIVCHFMQIWSHMCV